MAEEQPGPHRTRHPDWEAELISRPSLPDEQRHDHRIPELEPGAGDDKDQHPEPEAPRFIPSELAPPIGDIALRVA